MSGFIRCFVLFVLFSIVTNDNLINLGFQDPNNFGPYNLNYTRFDFCTGPKSKNLTTNSLILRSEGYKFFGEFNLTFLVATHIDQVKIVVYSLKDEKIANVLWTYKVNDPCKHYAIAASINNYLKAPNCNVNKGSYFSILNFQELQSTFFGTSFFYGTFLLKVTVISKKGNIMCMIIGMIFTKKSGRN